MEIVKHGNLYGRMYKFCCEKCGCEFTAKLTEITCHDTESIIYTHCPECFEFCKATEEIEVSE